MLSNRVESESIPRVIKPCVAMHTRDGKFIYTNEHSLKPVDLRAADVIGNDWRDFSTEETREREIAGCQQALDTEAPVFLPLVKRNYHGSVFVADLSISPFKTSGGSILILREVQIVHKIDDIDSKSIKRIDDDVLDTINFLNCNIKDLINIARRDGFDLLEYMLDMARLEVERERREIIEDAMKSI